MKKLYNTGLLIILIAWLPMFVAAWDKNKPAANTSIRSSNPEMLANNTALETAFDRNHDFTTGSTQTGRHNIIELIETANLGTGAEGLPIIGAQAIDGKAEFVFTDEDDNDIQLTSVGNRLANNTYFTATDNAGTGSVNLFKATTGDALSIPIATSFDENITMANSKILTAETIRAVDSTGLVLQNDTPTNVISIGDDGFAHLADGSKLATSAAPTGDAQIANKKYVDDLIAAEVTARSFGTWTNKDSLNATLVKSEVYKVGSDGFVCVYRTHSGTDTVSYGYTDSANPPTTVRGAFTTQGLDNKNASFMMPIKNDDYFKITATNITPTIYWLPVGSGTCVKQ